MILVLLVTAPALAGDEAYKLGPDSMRQEGVPQGTVTKDVWHSKVFPNTVRGITGIDRCPGGRPVAARQG